MRYQELTLDEYRQLISEYHLTNEMPPKLLELAEQISDMVTRSTVARVWNEHGKHFLPSEKEDCKQVLLYKLLRILGDRSKATACNEHPDRWLYRIAQNEASEFTGRFLSAYERALAFELRDMSSSGSLDFVREVENRLQLEKFLRYLREGLSAEKARRYETTVRMLSEGATQEDVAAFFGVKQPNVARWMKQIRERGLKFIKAQKCQMVLLIWLLPLFYGN